MALVVDVVRRLGSFALQARFASEGKLTAFFGPSGSGKTSLLNIIAGIVRPDQGSIVLNGRTLVDTSQGIFVPKHRRRFGYVFQEARLFPHLTVRQNLLYGQWFTPRKERTIGVDQVLDAPQYPAPFGSTSRRAVGRRKTTGGNRPCIAHVAASAAYG